MPFGLTNAPASLQEMIDTHVQDMEECIWYLHDIHIYGSNNEAEHQAIVDKVLQQCVEHELAINLLKSKFHLHETIFLVNVINSQEVTIGPSKLKTMSKWPIPTKKKEVQVLLGFTNYYCQCIVNHSTKARPLIDLTKMCTSPMNTYISMASTNFGYNSSQLPTSLCTIEPLRQSWKLMLATKQLLASYLNTTSSTHASSSILLRTTVKLSPPHNATGQSMIRNCS